MRTVTQNYFNALYFHNFPLAELAKLLDLHCSHTCLGWRS